jgi:hypothetical protein
MVVEGEFIAYLVEWKARYIYLINFDDDREDSYFGTDFDGCSATPTSETTSPMTHELHATSSLFGKPLLPE